MFVGRKTEQLELKNFLSGRGQAALVYGRRRIGKTSLIKHVISASDDSCFMFFEAIEGSYESNLMSFTRLTAQKLDVPLGSYPDFLSLFSFIAASGKALVIIIDEYQYLKLSRKEYSVDSEFKQIIDNIPSGIKLILSGSYITIMKELLAEENPLFGRFSLIMNLKELNYLESQEFYSNKSTYEKVCFYAVFGGCPYILEHIEPDASLEENIVSLLVNENSVARAYIEYVLFKETGKANTLNEVLSALSNSKKRYSQIESELNMKSNGLLSTYLKQLIDMNLITTSAPINKRDDKKKVSYMIKDNLVRFYYAYVFKNRSLIQNLTVSDFLASYISPSLNTFISYRFEGIVMDYLRQNASSIENEPVLNIGSYWYDDPSTKTNGEFDVVVQYASHYSVYEVKFYIKPMSKAEIEKEAGKIRRIKELAPVKIGFVSAAGFEVQGSDYNYLTLDDIYQPNHRQH